MSNITQLVRAGIQRVKPYASARDEFSGQASIYLDANESPYPTAYNRYPDPHQRLLKEKISALRRVHPNSIFLGNGSDEAIDLLLRVFCEPGRDRVIIPQPTYGMYAVSASINLVEQISAPLTSDFQLNVEAIEKLASPDCKMLFLCNPSNPSGNLLRDSDIEAVLSFFPGIVVIDEAYIDFAESPGWAPRLPDFPKLVVLQTFSKAWGLAGLRLGMAFASVEIISWMNRIKPPYNINTLTQQRAMEKISGPFPEAEIAEVKQERTRLARMLAGLKITEHVYPSDTNFLLVRVKNPNETYAFLLQHGIVVRNRSNVPGCENCLRITVGLPEENTRLIDALRTL
jgi:histidinol-phosphate aminotransferase